MSDTLRKISFKAKNKEKLKGDLETVDHRYSQKIINPNLKKLMIREMSRMIRANKAYRKYKGC